MKKILFLFNQLLDDSFSTGGDVLGKMMLHYSVESSDFEVSVMAPKFACKSFPDLSQFSLGKTLVEKKLYDYSKVYTIFPLYIARAVESLGYINQIDADIVYTTGDFLCNVLPAYLLKKRKGVLWVACVYHINESPFHRTNNFFRSFVSFVMQRLSFIFIKRGVDILFLLNEEVKSYFVNMKCSARIEVTGAGLDVAQIKSWTEKEPDLSKEKRLVFFGRVNPTKGIFDLPEIFSTVLTEFPDYVLDIIGGTDTQTLEKLKKAFAAKGCLDKVNFYGFVKKKEDVYKILRQARVYVFPSYEEGWGISLFEAIMCGTLPVVYDLSVYKENFGNLLITAPKGNVHEFSKKVVDLLKNVDKEYSTRLKSCQDIVEKYDWKRIYDRQVSVINKFDL